jgi:hypothetical protein
MWGKAEEAGVGAEGAEKRGELGNPPLKGQIKHAADRAIIGDSPENDPEKVYSSWKG